jgi:hypothetical protein
MRKRPAPLPPTLVELLERLTIMVDGRFDAPGLAMERARLPRRVHLRRESPVGSDKAGG